VKLHDSIRHIRPLPLYYDNATFSSVYLYKGNTCSVQVNNKAKNYNTQYRIANNLDLYGSSKY